MSEIILAFIMLGLTTMVVVYLEIILRRVNDLNLKLDALRDKT